MGRFITLALALAGIWLLLSGYFDKPLLLIFGAVSSVFAAWLAWRAGMLDGETPADVFPGIIGYMLWITGEVGKANIMVMRQALAIEPKLSPRLFTVPNPPRTELGKVIFANSITLTPGTVTITLGEEEILVHGLTEELADPEGIAEMAARVVRIERPSAERSSAGRSSDRRGR